MLPKNKLLGGILLVAGLTIGAGMLGLPVITALAGFWPSVALMAFSWVLMLVTGFLLLDVNLSLSGGPNLVSMAGRTLGVFGKSISWILSLLLLYSLATAYIAGISPLLMQASASLFGYPLPSWIASLAMPVLLGGVIYLGTLRVDHINRFLMVGLAISYGCLVAFIPSQSNVGLLEHKNSSALIVAVTVLFTSFGYHAIIPSLTAYMNYDRRQLRWAVAIGSAIPLFIYILWEWLIHTSVPPAELILAWQQGQPATVPLAKLVKHSMIASSAQCFSFFAIITSFLGIALSLSHFLADGLRIKNGMKGRFLSVALTFGPPILFVLIFEKGFYVALEYAGAIVAVLSGILPACMAWTLKGESFRFYRSWKGRVLLLTIIAICISVIVMDALNSRELVDRFIVEFQKTNPQLLAF